MSERTLPSSDSAGRDILGVLWRALASSRMTAVLLVLLAMAVLITLLFSPQRPGPSASAAELVQWTSEAQMRFGSGYEAFLALGFFNVGTTVWLRLLLGLSALSLAISLADGAARVVQTFRQPDVRRPESFFKAASSPGSWSVSQPRTLLLGELAQRFTWPIWLPWRRLRIQPRLVEENQVSYLFQDWLTWRRAASLLLHMGVLFVLVGAGLDARLGWRQDHVTLMPGQVASLDRLPGFSLRLERVEGQGTAGQTVSQVALEGPDGTSVRGMATLGRPYTAHGVTIYQRDVGPILRVSARGVDGSDAVGSGRAASILLKDASVEMEPADEIRLMFTESRVEHHFLMPYIRKMVRLVLYRQGERWDPRRDELLVEVYTGISDVPEAEGRIVGDGLLRLDNIDYEFVWEQYAILDVVRSSWLWLVRVGMGLVLLGLAVTLLMPSARLWVRIVEERATCTVEVAGEMPGEPEALAVWLAAWRRRLEGRDADG